MKIEYRYEKVPCFGNNPKVDVELMRKLHPDPEDQDPMPRRLTSPAVAITAVAITTILFVILCIRLLQHLY